MSYHELHLPLLIRTIHSDWSKRGGIVGRGVLLDYVSFAARHNIEYDPMSRHCICLSDIEKMAEEQSLTFHPGDILLIRTGWIKWYEEHNEQERRAKVKNGDDHIGIEGSEAMFEWLWDQHFAAVASDTVGVEAFPPTFPWCESLDFIPLMRIDYYTGLHDYALSMWGMPLGELWDLESLAITCEEEKRWSFFLTSAPLNNPGGIASPPNAIAIF